MKLNNELIIDVKNVSGAWIKRTTGKRTSIDIHMKKGEEELIIYDAKPDLQSGNDLAEKEFEILSNLISDY